MLPSTALVAGLLARQRAHLVLSAAQRHLSTTSAQAAAAAPRAEYAPSAVGGPGSGSGDDNDRGGAVRMRATTILAVRLGGELVLIGDGQATANDFVVKPNVRKLRRLGPVAPSPITAGATAAKTAMPATAPATTTAPRLSETAAAASPVIAGFAGLAADGLALLDRLDAQVRAHPGQLRRAAVELAKAWRQDRALRELDAAVLVADGETTLWLAGNGDVLESADGVVAVGSGSDFAEAAARALIDAAAEAAGAGGGAGGVAGVAGGAAGAAALSPRSPLNLTALDIARRAMRVAADSCVYTNHRWTWFRLRRTVTGGGETAGGEGDAAASPSAPSVVGVVTVAVDEGSEDGLLTTAGPPEPTHGGDVV